MRASMRCMCTCILVYRRSEVSARVSTQGVNTDIRNNVLHISVDPGAGSGCGYPSAGPPTERGRQEQRTHMGASAYTKQTGRESVSCVGVQPLRCGPTHFSFPRPYGAESVRSVLDVCGRGSSATYTEFHVDFRQGELFACGLVSFWGTKDRDSFSLGRNGCGRTRRGPSVCQQKRNHRVHTVVGNGALAVQANRVNRGTKHKQRA